MSGLGQSAAAVGQKEGGEIVVSTAHRWGRGYQPLSGVSGPWFNAMREDNVLSVLTLLRCVVNEIADM